MLACAAARPRAAWTRNELTFLAWTRETGVVPASVAGLLIAQGVPTEDEIVTVVALAIIVTLVLQATTKAWLARRLDLMEEPPHEAAALQPSQLVAIAFALAILVGSFLLWLPISTTGPGNGSFLTAVFTSTSAICVTGLIVADTPSYYSQFGEVVIMGLVQVGGFGIMTLDLAARPPRRAPARPPVAADRTGRERNAPARRRAPRASSASRS